MDWQTEIKSARDRIAPNVRRTPVMELRVDGVPHPVALKLEQMQHTGSFKVRGAFNTLLSREVPDAGVVAASGGNHGAAVAYAARQLGHAARIFVPEIAGPSKTALIERTGADLVVVKGAYANALEAAQAYEADTGAMQIHAYDAQSTVAGQGSFMLEWEEQGLNADTVLIAVGGGGLIAGALGWLAGRRKVVAVESETCNTLRAARMAGEPVDIQPSGLAANALGARRIGEICFDMVEAQNVQSLLVSDDAIAAAQALLWRETRQLVEPAGAAALAALTSGVYKPDEDERVAVLICGGNIAPDPMA
ncbi:MAG: threonine/serine dehydratase [Pseudomonadota bacterium]